MKEDARAIRRAEITRAAYELIGEKGFHNMSMLAVAKRAKASNETLYRWFGDKNGLFRALIEDNAATVATALEEALAGARDSRSALNDLGPELLSLLLGRRAVALNRAAAADASGVLGKVLADAGRGKVFPLIQQLFQQLETDGVIRGPGLEAAAFYLDVLAGDLQIRRATSAMPAPDAATITARAKRAEALLMQVYGVAPKSL